MKPASFPRFMLLPVVCCLLAGGCDRPKLVTPTPPTPFTTWSGNQLKLRSKGDVVIPKPIPGGMCMLGAAIDESVNQFGKGAGVSGSFGNAKGDQIPFRFAARPNQYCEVFPVIFDGGKIFVAAVYCNRPVPWAELEAKLRAEGDLVLSGSTPQDNCTLGGLLETFPDGIEPQGKIYVDPNTDGEKEYSFPSRKGFECKVYAVRRSNYWSVFAAAVYVPTKDSSPTDVSK